MLRLTMPGDEMVQVKQFLSANPKENDEVVSKENICRLLDYVKLGYMIVSWLTVLAIPKVPDPCFCVFSGCSSVWSPHVPGTTAPKPEGDDFYCSCLDYLASYFSTNIGTFFYKSVHSSCNVGALVCLHSDYYIF